MDGELRELHAGDMHRGWRLDHFLAKGLPELSIKWYRRGLEAPNLAEEDRLGLMYDLGNAYMAMGDDMSAYGAFVELYGINSNYRDVVAKLEELRK